MTFTYTRTPLEISESSTSPLILTPLTVSMRPSAMRVGFSAGPVVPTTVLLLAGSWVPGTMSLPVP